MKLRQPSFGTKLVTLQSAHSSFGAYFLPFLMSWTRTHFRTAELGCLASMPIFSNTIPLPWEAPLRGDDFQAVPRARLRKCSSAHLFSRRWIRSLRAALRPAGFPLPMLAMYVGESDGLQLTVKLEQSQSG